MRTHAIDCDMDENCMCREANEVAEDIELALARDNRERTEILKSIVHNAFLHRWAEDSHAMYLLKLARTKMRYLRKMQEQQSTRLIATDKGSGYVLAEPAELEASTQDSMRFLQDELASCIARLVRPLTREYDRIMGYSIRWWLGPNSEDIQVDFQLYDFETWPTQELLDKQIKKDELDRLEWSVKHSRR